MTQRQITKAEASVKKRQFAELILNTENRMTKQEIMDALDITEYTYQKWSADPDMVEWTGIEPWRYSEKRKQYARVHKLTAMQTLVDVMMNSRSDQARVKAAETMLLQDDATQEEASNVNALEVEKLLTKHSPTFIFNMTEKKSEDVIEGEYIEVD